MRSILLQTLNNVIKSNKIQLLYLLQQRKEFLTPINGESYYQTIESIKSMKHITIYTDASCKPNPGYGGLGIVFANHSYSPPKLYNHKCISISRMTTSYECELLAIKNALKFLISLKLDLRGYKVLIFCDNQTIVNCIQKTAEAKIKKHGKLILECKKLMLLLQSQTEIHWVKGHSNILPNEAANALANKAVNKVIKEKKQALFGNVI